MVSLADGDKFKACLQGDAPCSSPETIALTFQWSLPTSSGVVDWELWTISQGGGSSAVRARCGAVVKRLRVSVCVLMRVFMFSRTELHQKLCAVCEASGLCRTV